MTTSYALEEHLVAPFPTSVSLVDDVEIERRYFSSLKVVGVHDHLAATDGGGARIHQRQVARLAAEHQGTPDAAGPGERSRGIEGRPRTRCQPGRERAQVGKAVPVDVELLMRDVAVAVRIEGQGVAGDIGAVVDQLLRDAVPAGVLGAVVVVVHAAELDFHPVEVQVEGRLQNGLVGGEASVIAVRVLDFRIQVVAEFLAAQPARPADLGGADPLFPGTGFQADRPGDAVLARPDVRGLRVEVDVSPDLGGSVNGRCRAANDVHPVGGGDGRRVVARVVKAANAPEIGLARRPADVQRAGHAEERLRETAGRERNQFVDVPDDETAHHLFADRRGRTRRFQYRLVEPEDRPDIAAGHAAEIRGDDDFFDFVVVHIALGRRIARAGDDDGQRDCRKPRKHAKAGRAVVGSIHHLLRATGSRF